MMKGLPASGKSTRAREIMEKRGNLVRLNRDALRQMLHFNKWTGNNEKITMKVQRAMAKELLLNNVNVIIDDTNLGKSHRERWENLCKEVGAKFAMENLSKNIDLKELFDRDISRRNPIEISDIKVSGANVGRHVIVSLGIQHDMIGYRNFGDGRKKWIVCDIDGTIADLHHRLHFVKGVEVKNWKEFFNHMSEDTVIEDVRDTIIKSMKQGYPIIFVSGRPDSHRDITKEWLENVAFKDIKFVEGEDYATILMRRSIDHREDTVVKEDILKNYLKPENIHMVFDDRPRVIKMWESHGLTVVDVGPGVDF
ncbi:MAG: AAA family ATPase [Patescibacteria group bacterium]|nr:AAA family ATPase [Patescibacteria group bacterium]